jgi:hypothetical protein
VALPTVSVAAPLNLVVRLSKLKFYMLNKMITLLLGLVPATGSLSLGCYIAASIPDHVQFFRSLHAKLPALTYFVLSLHWSGWIALMCFVFLLSAYLAFRSPTLSFQLTITIVGAWIISLITSLIAVGLGLPTLCLCGPLS